MFAKRTDLALEAKELWQESAADLTRLSGVRAKRTRLEGYPVTRVDILDRQGAESLGKPEGSYRTVDLTDYCLRRQDFFPRAVRAVGAQLKELLPEEGSVLVVCLGNEAMTPDAVGPLTAKNVLITRHLISSLPQQFAGLRPVSALCTGVLGTTGLEAVETVRGVTGRIRPAAVIAVDALAARRCQRVCSTIQISDTGIIPGSGVGNHRVALNRETLGVPVFAVGVPTVVDGATLAADLLEESGIRVFDPGKLRTGKGNLMVTPQDIDARVRDLAKVIGYGINWALQALDIEEISALLG